MPPHTSNLRNLTNPHVSARWLRLLLLPNTYAWLLPTTGFRSSITAYRAPTRIRRAKRPTRNSQPSPAQPSPSRLIASRPRSQRPNLVGADPNSAPLDSTRPGPSQPGLGDNATAAPTCLTLVRRLSLRYYGCCSPPPPPPVQCLPRLALPRLPSPGLAPPSCAPL